MAVLKVIRSLYTNLGSLHVLVSPQAALVNGLRSSGDSAVSISSHHDTAAAAEEVEAEAPRIELSTTDLKKQSKNSADQLINNNNNNVEDSSTHAPNRLSAPTTTGSLSRLFQKRSHKSTTDVVVDKRCDSNRCETASPSHCLFSDIQTDPSGHRTNLDD